MMRSVLLVVILLLVVLGEQPAPAVQAQSCAGLLEEAVLVVDDACAETGRNQACYGHAQITAEGRSEAFQFQAVNDIVGLAEIVSLQADALDEDAGTWGISLLRAQVSLPDALPGQNVTFLVFGGTRVENAVDPAASVRATVNAASRVRSTPDSTVDSNIVTALEAGTPVLAFGRTESGDWVRIRYNEQDLAWIASFLLDAEGSLSDLPVLAAFNIPAPPVNPMEAFYLLPGLGQTACEAAPPDGVLVQTPQGATNVRFTVNGVRVTLGSTLLITLAEDGARMDFALFNGSAIIQTLDPNSLGGQSPTGTALLVPGTQVSVPLAADGRSPAGPPGDVEPTDAARAGQLGVMLPLLESANGPTGPASAEAEPVTLAEPVPAAEVEAAVAAAYYPYGLMPGTYLLVAAEINPIVEPSPGMARCYQYFAPGSTLWYVENASGGVRLRGPDLIINGNTDTYGDPLTAHSSPDVRTLPADTVTNVAQTVIVTSPATFTYRETFAYRYLDGVSGGACEATFYWALQSP